MKLKKIQKDNRVKLIIGAVIFIGILYIGMPFFNQSSFDSQNIMTPQDAGVNNGDFVESIWIRDDGTFWGDYWWGYMISVDDVPAFTEIKQFEGSDVTTAISYIVRVQDKTQGDVIKVTLTVYGDSDLSSSESDDVLYTVLDSVSSGTTETTTNSQVVGNDMDIIYIMAMAGGAIFVLAIIATIMGRR